MGRASFTKDPPGRAAAPATGLHALAPDRFKERADRLAARKGGKPKADAFAAKGQAFHNPFDPKPAPLREAAFKPAVSSASRRTLANGAALQVVASRRVEVVEEKLEEIQRERKAAKSSSLVLVSSSSVVEAEAEPVTSGGGQGGLVMPKLSPPKPKAKPKSGGGGGGAGSGAGAGEPPRDRIFNQDDLAGVLIGLVLLLLLALYLLRGGAAGSDYVVSTQSLAAEPVAEPVGPPPDPFGNQVVDLTPKSPPPPEAAAIAAAPAPAAAPATAAVEVRLQVFFCTAKSELTPASLAALDKQIFDLGGRLSGKELVVTGYADTRGDSAYNTWLGGERAAALASYLTAKGIKTKASAVGELPDLTDNENCPNQRRVDVRLSDAPAEAPSRSCAPPQELAELACD